MKLGFLLTFLCGSLLCQGQSKRATVAVEVTDPGGAGVSRAEGKLSPQPQDGAGQLETASDGKRTLKLKPGTYNLSESCAGFKMSSKRFTVRETDEIQALSVGLTDSGYRFSRGLSRGTATAARFGTHAARCRVAKKADDHVRLTIAARF